MNRLRNKLFIFDKDGTLNYFHKSFIPWIKEIVSHVNETTQNKIYEELGVDIQHNLLYSSMSPLAVETHDELKSRIKPCILDCTLEEKQLLYHKFDTVTLNQIPVDNLKTIIDSLMINNKVALYTSDNYLNTSKFIRENDLSFSSVIHSDSEYFGSKTNMSIVSIEYLMKKYNISGKENVFFISDTINDMIIGKKANIGTIGVLSGAGCRAALEEIADIVVDDINYL